MVIIFFRVNTSSSIIHKLYNYDITTAAIYESLNAPGHITSSRHKYCDPLSSQPDRSVSRLEMAWA